MQQVLGYSALTAGFAYVPLAVAVVLGAGLASGLVTKVAARSVLLAGLAVTVAGLLLLARAPADSSYVVDVLPAFVALGIGCGMGYVTLQIAAFDGVHTDEAGVGAGLINTSQEAGGALGLAVIATIAYSGFHPNGSVLAAQTSANHTAFLAAAAIGLIALASATQLPGPARQA
jgi:MFS family permease